MTNFQAIIQDILEGYRVKLRVSTESRRSSVLQDMKKELGIMKETWEMLHGKIDGPSNVSFEEVMRSIN